MIYLKNYKIFESINLDFIDTLEDYCLDFKDLGLWTHRSNGGTLKSDENDFFISIQAPFSYLRYFKYKDLIPTIESISLMMHENGFDTKVKLYNCTDESNTRELKDPEEINLNNNLKRLRDFNKAYPELKAIKIIFQKKSNLKTYEGFILESVKFIKQPKKTGAKTDTYNVSKNDVIIGQIKWSSRMRGYAFLPTSDCDIDVKDFIKDLMKKRREDKKGKKN